MDGISRINELEQKFNENPRRYFAPLANEYRKAGNPQKAIAICQAHLGQMPGHMSGQIVYGQALFEGGEFEQARTVFENALAMDRENLIALRHLGDLALRNGEKTAARQWYAKLLEIDPQDSAAIALVNEIDTANDAAPDAAPAPPQAFVTETMAELYVTQGLRDNALTVYRQLVALRPDDERLKVRLDSLTIDSPPVDSPIEEPDSVALPVREDLRAEPEGVAAVAAQLTAREFFAALGRRRPHSRTNGSSSNGSSGDSSGGDVIVGDEVSGSDVTAAAALAGAFMPPPASQSAPAGAESASSGKESEEDVARFRAWLDGLTGA